MNSSLIQLTLGRLKSVRLTPTIRSTLARWRSAINICQIFTKTLTCGKTIQGDSGGPLVVLKRDTNEGLRCKFEMSRLVLKARFQHFIISRSILFGWGCFFWIQVRGTGKNPVVRIKNPFFCKILYETEFYPPTQSLSRKVDTSLSSVKCSIFMFVETHLLIIKFPGLPWRIYKSERVWRLD